MFRRLRDVQETLTLSIDGVETRAMAGETVASVFLCLDDVHCRLTPVTGAPRAPFCLMGACFDCLATIDGKASQRGCMTPVADGMVVTRQTGARSIAS